ncbi:biogenesis of lysosome-related organelles complex 1 subunit 4 isoform X2 [Hemiscyllium ocellatum]|uniref:biogenesis of lysosome-related organelles complex 1 subunit 4 isoform X2 n=1 Tax=Hemiscyllium ocellatum TaxID=170820 RepID=UPI002965D67E|nr:biogenesis of lysosome-related organelles complex 1 subunit 4 isoform X2 [Hemiscyllium ocellatum]
MEEEGPQALSEAAPCGIEQQQCEDGTACPVEAGAESEQEALLWNTASCYSSYLTATAQAEIRNDSSQIMNENIPEIHVKADEMKQLYNKIDKLEAFVKMVGQNVCVLDNQLTQAEAEVGSFPSAFRKIWNSIGSPAFLNKSSLPKRQQQKCEPPALFRTEDYFPVQNS